MRLFLTHIGSLLGQKSEPADCMSGKNQTLEKVTSRVMVKKEIGRRCMGSFSDELHEHQLRAASILQDRLSCALLPTTLCVIPKAAQVSWRLQAHCWREKGGRQDDLWIELFTITHGGHSFKLETPVRLSNANHSWRLCQKRCWERGKKASWMICI